MTQILFLTPYYPPERGASPTRTAEMAQRLAQRGHEVTVLTTVPNFPSGNVPPEYRRGRRRHEHIHGVDIVRVWSLIQPNRGFMPRIVSQLSFGGLAGLLGRRKVGRQDIIFVQSPPLFDAFSGVYLAKRLRRPFIFVVADLWPESAIQFGVLKNPLLIRMATALEWMAYRRAAAIWALTDGIGEDLIARGIPPEKVFIIRNGVDTKLFRPIPRDEARALLGWDDRFTALFLGTAGLMQGLGTLIDASDHLRAYPDVHVMIMGDGVEKASLVDEARRRGLSNITFADSLPHDEVPLALAAADVCVSTLRKIPLTEGAIPAKLAEYMASGRPIVLASEGLSRRLIVDEARAAIHVPQEEPQAMADAILYLRDHPEAARTLGLRGRAYAESHHDRDLQVSQLEQQIERILASWRARVVPRAGARSSVPAHHDDRPAHDLTAER